MKYSIRGNFNINDGTAIVDILNRYTLWKLETNQTETFNFEVWVNTETDKTNLFNELKPFVDQFGEVIDWHECSHDEVINQPCAITEEYRR